MTADAALETFERDLRRRRLADESIRLYLRCARAFVAHAGVRKRYDRRQFLDFFDQIGALSPSWIRTNHTVLRSFCASLGQEMPVHIRELPKRALSNEKLAVTKGDVEAMVRAALTPAFDDEERCALALSTTYGLRVSELRTCHVEGGELVVHVAKGGGIHRHRIPRAVRAYVSHAPVRLSQPALYVVYHRLEKAAGIARARHSRGAWHIIRRSLNTALLSEGKVPYAMVKSFLRWPEEGWEAPMYYLVAEAGDVDQQVFRSHPYLPLWAQAARRDAARAS